MRALLSRALTVAGVVVLAACGGEEGDSAAAGRAKVVVTTNILGDVVTNLVADDADVEIVMPPGSNPHDFAPSAQQAVAMRDADLLVVNGAGFEERLVDTIESAEEDGVAVLTATDALAAPLGTGEDGTDDHGLGPDEHDPDAAARNGDAHFFTDPVLMHGVVEHLADGLAEHVDGLDTPGFRQRVDDYLGELNRLTTDVTTILHAVADERRLLVTNHEVLGSFADRFHFDVLGVIIPGGSTLAEPSAADLADLADDIDSAGVPAVFVETSGSAGLAGALAAEGADVEVVELYAESLGPPGSGAATYLDMVRTNAERIAAALR